MQQTKTIWAFAFGAIILPVAAYMAVTWYENKYLQLPVLGKSKMVADKMIPHQVGDFLLTNQEGKTITTESWKGKIVVCNFFFTRCPSICPTMTRNIKFAEEYFKENENIIFNSISVDPENDHTEQLHSFAELYDIDPSSWQLLTGDKKEIYKLARNSFLVVATDGDGGPNDFIHSESVILIDPQRRIRGYYNGTEKKDIKKLIADIKKLENEN